ncbi:MAG TPA: hypothetical protein VM344_00900 [Vitreimonas sp.]|nr:hypothetical protein [Vitreimonas sp.]
MTAIEVTCSPHPGGDGWACVVVVTDATGSGRHIVRVRPADLRRYAPGATEPADLARRSFEFLLEREPRSSILSAFDLPVIERYFPEYASTIGRRPV